MPSPFPGMDPYLEHLALWPDVHHELISGIREQLNRLIRPGYVARVEERTYLPEADVEDIREARVEIIDANTRNIVTVIEVISPSNKIPVSAG